MKRPEIKDKAILKYVEHLEKTVEAFDPSSPIVKLYIGLMRQVDDLGDLLTSEVQINVEGKIENHKLMSHQALMSKDEKTFDRYMVLMKSAKSLKDDLEAFHKDLSPELVDKVELELRDDAAAERHIFGKK